MLKPVKFTPSRFNLLTLALLICCTLSVQAFNSSAHAADNPAGSTITGMTATPADSILNNYGNIINSKTIGPSLFGMYGYTATDQDFSFSNYGTIDIAHTTTNLIQANAEAMRAQGDGNHTLTNDGTIINTATATKTVVGDALSTAYAMNAVGEGSHSLTNSGTITNTATATHTAGGYAKANAHAIIITGIGDHTLSNSGIINVTATANTTGKGEANAYGMFLWAAAGVHLLNNTGVINVKATNTGSTGTAEAFEAYGGNSYNVGTWATTLRDWTGRNAVFGAANANTVTFANSKLILRPGTAAQGFELGKVYIVANMVAINGSLQTTNSASVHGTISSVETEVDFLKATLVGSAANTATVKLESNISASTTPGITTMQQAVAKVQGQFNNLSTSLRNALVEIYTQANLIADAEQNNTSGVAAGSGFNPSNKWQVFLTPYANSVNNSDLEYGGSSIGITAGANYRVNEQFSFGGHLDFNAADYSADVMDMSSKSTSFALGLHAAFNFTPEWYLRGQLTGSINQNDNYYEIGAAAPLTADTTHNGEAMYAALSSGYTWQVAPGHSLTPEVGLSYLGTHTGAYDIKWSGATAAGGVYDLKYDDSYYNAFYANINLDWRSEWALADNRNLALLVGAGLRQKLSANDMETSVGTLGSKFTTQYTEDPTTFLVNAGLEYNIDNLSISLNYDGGFGTYQTSHGGNVMVKFEF